MTQTQTQDLTDASGLADMDGFEQLLAFFDGRLPSAPIAETLGLENFGGERGAIHVGLQPRPCHYNPIGSVHGGVLATLLDTAAGCSVHSTLAPGELYTSLDLTVKFLRPVKIAWSCSKPSKVARSGRLWVSVMDAALQTLAGSVNKT